MKVKIVRCSDDMGWWREHIGIVVDVNELYYKDMNTHSFVPTGIKFTGVIDQKVFSHKGQEPQGLVSDNSSIIEGLSKDMQFYIAMSDVVTLRVSNIKELGI